MSWPPLRVYNNNNNNYVADPARSRRQSSDLGVPSILQRSSSLNMLSEAFTAVHNLCVVPASAGKAYEEVTSQLVNNMIYCVLLY